MCDCFGYQHGDIAANGRKRRERPKRLSSIPASQEHVQVEFRQQHRVAQVVPLGQRRKQLTELTQLEFTEPNGGGFHQERRAVRSARVRHAAQAELVEKLLEKTFQIVNVELRLAFRTAPE